MSTQINIAPCGLVCSRCDAYRATEANDPAKLELVAAHWRKINHCDDIKAEYLPCEGCMNEGGRKSFFCENLCEVRRCALENGVKVCSECPKYPCETVTAFHSAMPEQQRKAVLNLLEAIDNAEKNMQSIL